MMLVQLVNRLKLTGKLMRTEERGATAVEYGLMVALIAAVIVGIVALIGDEVAAGFQTVLDELTGE